MRKTVWGLLLLAAIAAVLFRSEWSRDALPALQEMWKLAASDLPLLSGGEEVGEPEIVAPGETAADAARQFSGEGREANASGHTGGDMAGETAVGGGTGKFGELERQLAEGFQSRADRFTVSYTGDREELSDNMTAIIRSALQRDHYVAYILESYVYTIRSLGKKSTITVEAKFRESEEQTAEVEARVEQALEALLQPGMNEHEKVKAIHDWIVLNVQYDQSLAYYTAHDALFRGEAVCQGYALLGYKMLKKAGIPVIIAEGAVDTGEHAWNMVRLDGHWYHLDLTWDDPVGAPEDSVRYTYYLKTDRELREDHQWTKPYPAADTRYADALRQLEKEGSEEERRAFGKLKIALGLHWLEPEHTLDGEHALREAIRAAVRERARQLEFRYTDESGFPEALKAAFAGLNASVGYRASYEPYGTDGSLLVQLHIEY